MEASVAEPYASDDDSGSLDSQSLASDATGPHRPDAAPTGSSEGALQPQKAAVAVAVGVGSFNDPPELGGLAHFLEHMLFMGSERYPEENDYDAYLSNHGGYSNAFTECEHTCYHFDVNPEHLQPAMDRLAQFFVAPLLRHDAADRELCAVDSEFNNARSSDSTRLAEIRCRLSRPDHPYTKFTWGNKRSLATEPEAAGIDVQAALKAFHKKYYSARTVAVVVRGQDSLDELEAMTVEAFKGVGGTAEAPQEFSSAGMPFDEADLPRIVHVVPVREMHVLHLTWCVPSMLKHYMAKADDYVAHLVGHEARGSILYVLKERGLATSLSAGISDDGHDSSTACAFFQVSITLTEAGVASWQAVGLVVFQYLAILQGIADPPLWVHTEIAKMARQRYHYGDDEDPDDQAVRIASNMVTGLIQPEDLLIFDSLHSEPFNPDLVRKLVGMLTVDRVHVDLVSPTFKSMELDREEPWFSTKYSCAPLPADVVSMWRHAEPNPELGLPRPNPFVPSTLTLHPIVTDIPPAFVPAAAGAVPRFVMGESAMAPQLAKPVRIFNARAGKLWWKQDTEFGLPRANMYFAFYLPAIAPVCGRTVALLDLYVRIVNDSLNETMYQASLAELDFSLISYRFGIDLRFSGFTEKMPKLAQKVVARILSGEVKKDRFAVVQEQLLRECHNANINPTSHASYRRLLLLMSKSVPLENKIAAAEACTPEELQEFASSMLRGAYIEALAHGNTTPETAMEMFNIVRGAVPGDGDGDGLASGFDMMVDEADPWGDDESKVSLGSSLRLTTPIGGSRDSTTPASRRGHRSSVVGTGIVEEDQAFRYPDDPVTRMEPGVTYITEVPAKKVDDVNSAIQAYYQLGRDSLELRAGLDLLDHVMCEPAYDVLRTKEQLGYSVHTRTRLTGAVVGYDVTIQSAEYSCAHMNQRIEAFLAKFRTTLVDMTPEQFKEHVTELSNAKLTRDSNLTEQTDRWWSEIEMRRYDFSSPEHEAAAVRSMTQAQLVALFDAAFSRSRRKKLVVYVHRRVELPKRSSSPPPRTRLSSDGSRFTEEPEDSGSESGGDAGRAGGAVAGSGTGAGAGVGAGGAANSVSDASSVGLLLSAETLVSVDSTVVDSGDDAFSMAMGAGAGGGGPADGSLAVRQFQRMRGAYSLLR